MIYNARGECWENTTEKRVILSICSARYNIILFSNIFSNFTLSKNKKKTNYAHMAVFYTEREKGSISL
jgi:hypothetical protein